ncbi:MAG TPA: hypothetical protein ENN29_04880 [Candidatus Hydrogenedentes bacterium]|nr:hypothetical protein [Candidatus Hydrogenedentota bacterium]
MKGFYRIQRTQGKLRLFQRSNTLHGLAVLALFPLFKQFRVMQQCLFDNQPKAGLARNAAQRRCEQGNM